MATATNDQATLGPDAAPERLLRPAIALLDDADMQAVLGGTGRVVLSTDSYPDHVLPRGQSWFRVVVSTTSAVWGEETTPDDPRPVGLFFRVEAPQFQAAGWHPEIGMGLVHRLIYRRLEGWRPQGIPECMVTVPFQRRIAAPPMPFLDPPRGLWYSSAEYRGEVVAPSVY